MRVCQMEETHISEADTLAFEKGSSAPRLRVDLGKIADNAGRTVARCRAHNLEVVGVTKGVCGLAPVAKALLAGGLKTLGDSRLDNIARMRQASIRAPMMLLRAPGLGEVARCVALADFSLNGDLEVIEALHKAAAERGKPHGIILMLDLGTGREGVAPEDALAVSRAIAGLPGLQLHGIGTYLPFGSAMDWHLRAQQELVSTARKIEQALGVHLPVISGGSTNVFTSLMRGAVSAPGVSQLRIGTAILLGISSSSGPVPMAGLHQDTFVLDAEIIEIKSRAGSAKAVLALGEIDTDPNFLFPLVPAVKVDKMFCDHTVVDISRMQSRPQIGERLAFQLGYYALCRLILSPYVSIIFLDQGKM